MTETRQHKIERIYEVMADKTLSFGCIVDVDDYENGEGRNLGIYTIINDDMEINHEGDILQLCEKEDGYNDQGFKEGFIINYVLGHPVMIGDVLDYFQSNSLLGECIDLLGIWNNKRKQINDQSDETIKAIREIVCK